MKKLVSALCALLMFGAVAAPAYADHRGRGWSRGYDDYHYDRRRHRDRDNDAIVAGVVGLAIGALIGSAASRPRYAEPPRYHYRGCGYDPCAPRGHYGDSYRGGYYGPQPYHGGYDGDLCVVRERQWDPYAGRTLTIERQVPC